MKYFYENLKTVLAGFGIVALTVIAVTLAFGQSIGNQTNQSGQQPITYGRNIQITTLNDSEAIVVSGPQPTNTETNNFGLKANHLDIFAGSQPIFTIDPGGAISNLTSNAVQNTQINEGIQAFSNAVVAATAYTNWFTNAALPNGYTMPPVVILGHTLTSNQLLTVTTTNYTWTNIAGTAFQTAVAIGLTGH